MCYMSLVSSHETHKMLEDMSVSKTSLAQSGKLKPSARTRLFKTGTDFAEDLSRNDSKCQVQWYVVAFSAWLFA